MLKIFRLITNIRFYAGIVCMFLLMLVFSKTDVLSFRRLPSLSVSTTVKQSNTTYLTQQKIADNFILLTYANISVWHQWWTSSSMIAWIEDLNGDTVSKSLLAIKNLQTIRSTNVFQITNLQWADNGLSVLLQQWQTTLTQSQLLSTTLQWSVTEAQSQVDACTATKAKADELYRQWLSANDASMIDEATTSAKEASTCISTYGVSLKSLNGVLLNLNTEIDKTQKFLTLLTNNQWLIVQYNGILDGEVPSQLVQLQKDFQSI